MPLPDEFHRIIVEWAEAEPLIISVRLFGSYHQGTNNTDSDIDIAVGIDRENPRKAIGKFIAHQHDRIEHLTDLVGCKVDVQADNPSESPVVAGYLLDHGFEWLYGS